MRLILMFTIIISFIAVSYGANIYLFELPDNYKYKVLPDFILKQKQVKIQKKIRSEEKININLNGIFKISGEYVALINGESYKKGDKFKSYKISNIKINSVSLIKNGKKVTFYVEE